MRSWVQHSHMAEKKATAPEQVTCSVSDVTYGGHFGKWQRGQPPGSRHVSSKTALIPQIHLQRLLIDTVKNPGDVLCIDLR